MKIEMTMKPKLILCVIIALFVTVALGPMPSIAGSCEDLINLVLPNTTITVAQSVPAGNFTPPGSTTPITNLPAFCRVAGVVTPAIKFEVWMPTTTWNEKFNGQGIGGWAGSISYSGLATGLRRGYATATTDTGHVGGDTSWAVGHPELVVDYAYRAIHEMTVKSKMIVNAFYGKDPVYSYFAGCSGGGRQAFEEAQRYPGDYNGIIGGAPAFKIPTFLPADIWYAQATLLDPASYLTLDNLKLVANAAVAHCDALDGLVDGLIDDPRLCDFDPATLICQGTNTANCLTAAQVQAVKKIYDGPRNSFGQLLYFGLLPGGEVGWQSMVGGPAPFKPAVDFYNGMVFANPSWDWRTLNYDSDFAAGQAYASLLDTTNPYLDTFKALGGKLIAYHGWSDQIISPEETIRYYNSVVRTSGCPLNETQGFFRLFLAPGMYHCSGGTGPNAFDYLSAMENWVEKGIAPDTMIASHSTSGTVDRTRPLCPYPEVARYLGEGSIDDAANFTCVKTIPAQVRIEPETLDLDSKGTFTAFIRFPEGDHMRNWSHHMRDWEIISVVCEGASAVKVAEKGDTYIAKFNRQDLKNITPGKEVTFTVTVIVEPKWFHKDNWHHEHDTDQIAFEGSDTVKVVK